MTMVGIILAALYSFHVHGTTKQCVQLSQSLVNVAAFETTHDWPGNQPHANEDLQEIIKFKNYCKRKK